MQRVFGLALLLVSGVVSGHAAVSGRPRCIIPLTPALAEMVAELLPNSSDRICGVTEYSDRPASLVSKPRVGRYDRVSLETLVALKPDLVIAAREGNAAQQISKISEWKIPVLVTSTPDLSAIPTTIAAVGAQLGEPEAGQRSARALRAAFSGFQSRRAKLTGPKTRVFLQLGEAPLIGVGAGSFLNQALDWVGAENILADQKSGYPRISRELILQRKPDMILILAMGDHAAQFNRMAQHWAGIYTGPVHILRADALMRPNASIVEGLYLLEKAVTLGKRS